jgi:hypothetical protein
MKTRPGIFDLSECSIVSSDCRILSLIYCIVHVKYLSDQDEQYLVKPFLFYALCISPAFLRHNIEV